MKRGLVTATAVIKILVLYQVVVKRNAVYQGNIDCDIAGYKHKCYLSSCETTFKDRFGNYKKSFNHVKHKNDKERSKSEMEHQKLHGKLSEYVVLAIQAVSAAFYV